MVDSKYFFIEYRKNSLGIFFNFDFSINTYGYSSFCRFILIACELIFIGKKYINDSLDRVKLLRCKNAEFIQKYMSMAGDRMSNINVFTTRAYYYS